MYRIRKELFLVNVFFQFVTRAIFIKKLHKIPEYKWKLLNEKKKKKKFCFLINFLQHNGKCESNCQKVLSLCFIFNFFQHNGGFESNDTIRG